MGCLETRPIILFNSAPPFAVSRVTVKPPRPQVSTEVVVLSLKSGHNLGIVTRVQVIPHSCTNRVTQHQCVVHCSLVMSIEKNENSNFLAGTFLLKCSSERSHKGTLESCALRMRAHLRLMLLGVRLNIEVGGFPAVRALAACCNTQLIYTDTTLRPHKHLFAARKSLSIINWLRRPNEKNRSQDRVMVPTRQK